MKTQRGEITRVGPYWFGRWRQDELVRPDDLTEAERRELTKRGALRPGDTSRIVVRRQVRQRLCEVGDRYRSRRDVQPLLDEKLRPANENRACPASTMTVSDYIETFFLPFAAKELKPSTSYGYGSIFRQYLKPQLRNLTMRDARCVDITCLLAAIHQHHHLGRKSLRACKSMLGSVFGFAKRSGVLDGINPVRDSGIPRAAAASKPTHAYAAEEIFQMLAAVETIPNAKKAIALMFFAGLRPGEARAVTWPDYDGRTLRIRASMWRKHVGTPKTNESVAPIPVAAALRGILEESRGESGFILAGPTGAAQSLGNLACRQIVPRLLRCGKCDQAKDRHDEKADHEFVQLPTWAGWYACRRGLATLATSVDSALAAKGLLRHSNIATTQRHYIKTIPQDAARAMATIDRLFEKSASVVPN